MTDHLLSAYSVCGARHFTFIISILSLTCEMGTIITLILQMRTLRLRGGKVLFKASCL